MQPDQSKYHVLSPDGLPISPEPIGTLAEVEELVSRWCAQFTAQGYYAAVHGRIALEDLRSQMTIVPEAEALRQMSRHKESRRQALDELMKEAEFHADESLRLGCHARSILYLHRQDGTKAAYFLDEGPEDGPESLANIRRMCVAQNADAAVLCVEAWMRRGTSRPEEETLGHVRQPGAREEAVVLLGETRTESLQRVLPVIRMEEGRYFRFANEIDLQNKGLASEFGTFLSQEIPTPEMQQEATARLEADGQFPVGFERRRRGQQRGYR